jgi:hypothetical protein
MRRPVAAALLLLVVAIARCASSTPATAAPEPVTPADFVASIADVAAGRNPAMAEAGLVLKRIEFKLAVGTETKGGGKVEVLILDAETSRDTETSFVQELTLEIPASGGKRAAPPPLVPGVREFVDAAMNTARDLARAASAAGLPQQLRAVELTARITRSKKAGGGITATIPAWVKPSVGAELAHSSENENTVKMIFEREARPAGAGS